MSLDDRFDSAPTAMHHAHGEKPKFLVGLPAKIPTMGERMPLDLNRGVSPGDQVPLL